jgi:hypothetical protein
MSTKVDLTGVRRTFVVRRRAPKVEGKGKSESPPVEKVPSQRKYKYLYTIPPNSATF